MASIVQSTGNTIARKKNSQSLTSCDFFNYSLYLNETVLREITRTPVVLGMSRIRFTYHPLWVVLFTVDLWRAAITIKTTLKS